MTAYDSGSNSNCVGQCDAVGHAIQPGDTDAWKVKPNGYVDFEIQEEDATTGDLIGGQGQVNFILSSTTKQTLADPAGDSNLHATVTDNTATFTN